MAKERADLGFGSALDDFNPTDWSPAKPKQAVDRPRQVDTVKAAAAAGFSSREPKGGLGAVKGGRAGEGRQRRRRTGRNVQFNLKARLETIEAYCAIADAQGWGLGETLERAVELLEARYHPSRKGSS
jgi:hypothetical protein